MKSDLFTIMLVGKPNHLAYSTQLPDDKSNRVKMQRGQNVNCKSTNQLSLNQKLVRTVSILLYSGLCLDWLVPKNKNQLI